MFPVGIRHAHTFKSAIDGALSTIDTTIHVIFQHEAFGGTINGDKFNGLGWAILDTQTAAGTRGGIVLQIAAESFRRGSSFHWIELRAVLFEKRLNNILKHGSDFHNANPFHKIMTSSCANTKIAPKRHQSPTV